MELDRTGFISKLKELSEAVKNKQITNKDFVEVQNKISNIQKDISGLSTEEASMSGLTRKLNKAFEEFKTVKNAIDGYVSVNINGEIFRYKPSYIDKNYDTIFDKIFSKYVKDLDDKLTNDPANLRLFNKAFHNREVYEKSKAVKDWYALVDKKIKQVIKDKQKGLISEGKAVKELRRLSNAVDRVDKKIFDDYELDEYDPDKDIRDYQDTDKTDMGYYTIVSSNGSTAIMDF